MVYVSRFFVPASSGISAGDLEVGKIVRLNEKGTPVDYLVVNQGIPEDSPLYDASCEGTWLLRKDISENRIWDSGEVNNLEQSDIQSWLNGTMLLKYDSNIKSALKQVKIPYRQEGGIGGTDSTGANGLSCKIFLLSGYEVGWSTITSPYFPVDGAKLTYFESGTNSLANSKRVANRNGNAENWWLRSPYTNDANYVWYTRTNGDSSIWRANTGAGIRPALILPYDFQFTKEEVSA